jgi:trimethylamine--corrinoid protein Co-methyltransferase
MLDFESCHSTEKLVLDNEICAMIGRLLRGIEPREDFPARPLFEELLREKHLIISTHTRKYLRQEINFPGPAIDRANRARWIEEGGRTLRQRAAEEVERLVGEAQPSRLAEEVKREMQTVMERAAREQGMEALPEREP